MFLQGSILGGLRNSHQGLVYETKECLTEVSRLREKIAQLQVRIAEQQTLQLEYERAISVLEAAGFDKGKPQ